MYSNLVKPFLDWISALMAIVLLLPLFILVWCVLAIANSGKAFFIQPRPGRNEKVFYLIKFKTMNEKRDSGGNLLDDDKRLTKVGRFVRKTSLDELPQLVNILKGEMSFVGPRPLLVDYLSYYSNEERDRHLVKPGITGWAQVNGRNLLSWDEKFKYDLWYVKNQSLWLDLKVLFKTVIKVFKREGISAQGHATMPTFIEFVKKNRKHE